MVTLTRAEIAHYPGQTQTEQAVAHHQESRARAVRPKTLGGPSAPRAGKKPRGAGALALPRFLDLRPFPGRDRSERIVNWLIAHVPRAETWSRESLRELAERIAASSTLVE